MVHHHVRPIIPLGCMPQPGRMLPGFVHDT
ncbi:hypothetical protein clg_53 [Corynebacterium phage CL31]|nr:hypothetical protein clg_53 [Corynebacterium phage CL31]